MPMTRRMPSPAHRTTPAQLDRRTLEEALEERISGLTTWLREHAAECFDEQRHLDADTRERAYWHYGYLVALLGVLNLLGGRRRSLH